jgi:hypothetical protein
VRQTSRKLTYANVMSSFAVFLVLGGATAFAAGHLAKNSVGTKQLKANSVTVAKLKKDAVTGAKVKDGSLVGSDINLASLGTVPSAASAGSAATLSGRMPFTFFMPAGLKDVVTIGPFTIKASCAINVGGADTAELRLVTSVNGAAMDDNSGDEFDPFDIGTTAVLRRQSDATGQENLESDEGEAVAVAPDGTTIATENHAAGVNIAGHPGQCFFAGIVSKLG